MSISLCEDCVYYSYDEESDSYYCDEQLDEDEMASFLRGKLTACPFYHPGQSDYYLAGKHRLTRAHREKQLKMSCQALHNAPPNRT